MIKTIKRGALQVSKGLGLYRLLRDSAWRRSRLLILCYHGIALDDEHEWNPALYMEPSLFESRLRMLKRGGHSVLPLGEALQRLYSNTLPDRSVAITFDDGTYDFYKQAFPLLKKYGFPATVYVTTYYCAYNRPVFDVICPYLLWKARGAVVDLRGIIETDQMSDLRTEESRSRVTEAILAFATAKDLSGRQKDQLAEALARRLGIDYDRILSNRVLHLMNASELEYLSAKGVDLQLHTHGHRTPFDRALFGKEIRDDRSRLREVTGNHLVHFCYPNGSYDPIFLPWLAEDDMASAVTTEGGMASRRSNRLLLPRVVDHANLAPIEFEGWLTGVASVVYKATAVATKIRSMRALSRTPRESLPPQGTES